MARIITYALILIPLGLALSGCKGSERTEATRDRHSDSSKARAGNRQALTVADRRQPAPVNMPERQPIAKTKHDITLDQFRELVRRDGAVVIDARSRYEFSDGHVANAINVPASELGSHIIEELEQSISHDQLLIIYCSSASCEAGDMVFEYLAARGFSNMRIFRPGWRVLASAKDMQ